MNLNYWQPIETAPKDGQDILTDCGLVCWVNPREWGSPIEEGWHTTEGDNLLLRDSDGNSSCWPTRWRPVAPAWQPIGWAPTDGRVILTDSGLVKWDTAGKCESPRPPKWERCFFNGCLDLDSFNEDYPRPDVAPKYWLPVEIPPVPAK